MTMDINPFKELFSSLTQISQLNFEVWDDKGLVFSSGPDGTDVSISRQIEDFSTYVMSQAVFQHACFNGQQAIFGVPIRNEEKIIGTLLAYGTNSKKSSKPKAMNSRKMPKAKEMETLLTRLTGIMEDKWIDVKERNEIAEELSQSFEDLHLYSRIATQIKTLRFSNSMQNNLVAEILKTMRVDLSFVKMPERQENNVIVADENNSVKIPNPESFVENLLNTIPPDAPSLAENYFMVANSLTNTEYSELHNHPFRFLTIKIYHKDKFYGWLGVVSFNIKEKFRRSELRLLISMAEQLATVIANTDLYHDLERFIINMIKSLIYAIEAKDVYTRGHSERVSNYCMLMADHLELGKGEKSILQWASILHDVGKIGVPESILNKQAALDDEEYKIIKEHPTRGYNILQPIEQLSAALPGICHHHERYDGKGYPNGLKGKEIPLNARIIAVADTFDAITSKRAYREANGAEKAMTIIDEVAGTQLDPYLVSVFKEIYNKDIACGREEQTFLLEVSR